MKLAFEFIFRIALLVFTWLIWLWVLNQPLSNIVNLFIIVGCVMLVFPFVWLGKMILDLKNALAPAGQHLMYSSELAHGGATQIT